MQVICHIIHRLRPSDKRQQEIGRFFFHAFKFISVSVEQFNFQTNKSSQNATFNLPGVCLKGTACANSMWALEFSVILQYIMRARLYMHCRLCVENS